MSPRLEPVTRLVIATRNPGKLAEFRRLFAAAPFEIASLIDFPAAPEVDETGASYAANALLKARSAAGATGLPSLGDDSGLEVDALGGRPALQSARYSGGGAEDNVRKLLAELSGVPPERRGARFRCVLAVAWPSGAELTAEGICEGVIAGEPRGDRGFGYDPIFLDPATGRSFAELGPEEKDRISHRARAARGCLALLPVLADHTRE